MNSQSLKSSPSGAWWPFAVITVFATCLLLAACGDNAAGGETTKSGSSDGGAPAPAGGSAPDADSGHGPPSAGGEPPGDSVPTGESDAGDGGPGAADGGSEEAVDGSEPEPGDGGSEPVDDSVVELSDGDLTIHFDLESGTFAVARANFPVFEGATAEALVHDGTRERTISFAKKCAPIYEGAGVFSCTADGVRLELSLEIGGGGRFFTSQLRATNENTSDILILRLTPLYAGPENEGSLRLGENAATHRILENGAFAAFDQSAQMVSGDIGPFPLADGLPISMRGHSVSNWNHIIADAGGSGRSLVAGYLTFTSCIPTLGVAFDPAESIAEGATFNVYAADNAQLFRGKPLAPGGSHNSEILYVDPLPEDPLEALEAYASEVARYHQITPWPKRGPGYETPTGWNSWSGGSGTGGYGTDIDEPLILENMAVYQSELAPFGGTQFQLDDGWQVKTGDWDFNLTRFPSGGAGMAQQMRDAGFKPGIWIAPFMASPEAQIVSAHPDWFMPKEDGLAGQFGGSDKYLDFSNPDVRDHLHALFTRIRDEGWKFVKVDFTYWGVLHRPMFDPTLTNIEAWRLGYQVMRDALGPEVFLLGIGVMGTNIGILDGMRLTTDNGPMWEEPAASDLMSSPRAFKGIMRSAARRWFYQNRIWVNHPDLIFFRASPEPGVPPLTLEQSRTLVTFMGLAGGIIKQGDRLLDFGQHPEWIDIARRVLPVWSDGARPIDLLARDYPEIYHLPVHADGGEWDIYGLLNMGRNRDWAVSPPADLPLGERAYTLKCEDECLAYEFWTEQFLGKFKGEFSVTVPQDEARVVALRKIIGSPQLLGTNRHITMGAADPTPVAWNDAEKTLSGSVAGVAGSANAPWEFRLAFYVPQGLTAKTAIAGGQPAPDLEQDGQVVRLRFKTESAANGQVVPFTIQF